MQQCLAAAEQPTTTASGAGDALSSSTAAAAAAAAIDPATVHETIGVVWKVLTDNGGADNAHVPPVYHGASLECGAASAAKEAQQAFWRVRRCARAAHTHAR